MMIEKQNLVKLSLADSAALLRRREVSSRELTEAYLDRIDAVETEIGAYVRIDADAALAVADRADRILMGREAQAASPLLGIPAGIKDNICTKGLETTCASKLLLGGFVPPYNATVMERLNAAGIVMLGKVNMDEFAMGSTTENSAVQLTRNPAAPDRVPGGSSGGSGAAVAANEAAYTLGSDTGGSIRLPASFCGVVGMKPTYGAVSRYGLIAFASSLDQIGPITKTVLDNALVLDAICGHDKRDSTSADRVYLSFADKIDAGVKGMKIGVAEEFFAAGIDPEVCTAVEGAIAAYEKMGAELVKISMPSLKYALPAYYVISGAEASSNLARFDGVRYGNRAKDAENIDALYRKTRDEGFGEEVKRRIMTGTFALSSGYYDAYYQKAQQVRAQIRHEFEEIFTQCDLLASPVAPTAAYKIGEHDDDPTRVYLGDIYTVPANIAGLPAMSVPCGKTAGGLPVGLQLMGAAFSEPTLYRAAYALEQK